jgi:hypothetical protein
MHCACVDGTNSFLLRSINAAATGNTSFSAFQQAAIALNGTTTPGAPIPNLSGVGANATAVPGPVSGSILLTGAASGPTPNAPAVPPSAVATGSGSVSGVSSGASGAPSASGSSVNPPSSASSSTIVRAANPKFAVPAVVAVVASLVL